MVIRSIFPDIEIPNTGIIELLFKKPKTTDYQALYHRETLSKNRKVYIEVATGECITFAQLKRDVFRFAVVLQDKFSFALGDILASYAPNQVDYAIPLLGAVAAGGITTSANPVYTPNELTYQLQLSKANILIAHETNLENALKAANMAGIPKSNVFVFGTKQIGKILLYQEIFLGKGRLAISVPPGNPKEDVAYLCFSSGATGEVCCSSI